MCFVYKQAAHSWSESNKRNNKSSVFFDVVINHSQEYCLDHCVLTAKHTYTTLLTTVNNSF